jgi:signal peptidase II
MRKRMERTINAPRTDHAANTVNTASKSSRIALALAILITCIGLDQATKQLATETLMGETPRSYLGGIFRFEYALNAGAFLSAGSSLPAHVRFYIFTFANGVILLLVAVYLLTRWNMRLELFVPVAFLLAGGIGNLIDRVSQNGMVTDFMHLGVGSLRTGIFNVADVAITCGGLTLLVLTYRQPRVAAATLPVPKQMSS